MSSTQPFKQSQMESKQPSNELLQESHSTDVKEEPPEDEPEYSSFCYETVTKEEVIFEDQQEYANEQPESVSENLPKSSPEIVFKCSECNTTFDQRYKLNRCLNRHKAIRLGLFKCKVCDKCFGSKRNIVRHEAIHKERQTIKKVYVLEQDENGLFKCAECDRKHKERRAAIKCIKRHRARRLGLYQCKLCNLRTATKSEFKRHELKHTTSKRPFQNSRSEEAYEDPSKKVKIVACKICGKGLSSEYSLKRHELLIHKKSTSSENQALKEVPEPHAKNCSKEELLTDEKSETVIKEELIIQDEEYDDSAEDEQEEDSHCSMGENQSTEDEIGSRQENDSCDNVLEQSAPKQKSCTVCQMTFDNRHSLQMHSKTHSRIVTEALYEELLVQDKGSSNFLCLFCERPYSSRSETAILHVRRHINIIDGVFQCKNCGLRCATNYEYQNHVKIHNKLSKHQLPRMIEGVYTDYESLSEDACEKSDLPLHCKTCNVSFNNTANLNIHLWKSKLRIIRMALQPAAADFERDQQLPDSVTVKEEPPSSPDDHQSQTVYSETVVTKEELILDDDYLDYDEEEEDDQEDEYQPTSSNQKYTCKKCHKSLPHRRALAKHKLIHYAKQYAHFIDVEVLDRDGMIKCTKCKRTFKKFRSARMHFEQHMAAKDVVLLECNLCDMKFTKKYPYKMHMASHEKKNANRNLHLQYQCHECNKGYADIVKYRKHVRRHQNLTQGKFKCEPCSKAFASKQELKYHEQMSHNGLLTIKEHPCQESPDVPLLCTQCNILFDSRMAFSGHQRWIQNKDKVVNQMKVKDSLSNSCETPESSSLQCKTCHERFETEEALQTHAKTHKSDVNKSAMLVMIRDGEYQCSDCDKIFTNRSSAVAHIRRLRSRVNGKFVCKICNLRCTDNHNLKVHVAIHEKANKAPKTKNNTSDPVNKVQDSVTVKQEPHTGDIK